MSFRAVSVLCQNPGVLQLPAPQAGMARRDGQAGTSLRQGSLQPAPRWAGQLRGTADPPGVRLRGPASTRSVGCGSDPRQGLLTLARRREGPNSARRLRGDLSHAQPPAAAWLQSARPRPPRAAARRLAGGVPKTGFPKATASRVLWGHSWGFFSR